MEKSIDRKLIVLFAILFVVIAGISLWFAFRPHPLLPGGEASVGDVSLYQARLGIEDVSEKLPLDEVLPVLRLGSYSGRSIENNGRLTLTEDTLTLDLVVDDEPLHIFLSPQAQYAYTSGERLEIIRHGELLYEKLMAVLG